MLELDSISRRYGDVQALDDVSFVVRPGPLTGFVGTNGAGKTTAMRIVLGVARADSGDVRWMGRPMDLAARSRVGYMPEERGLYPKMRIGEQLTFFGRLHGLAHDQARTRGHELLERLGLGGRTGDRLDALSLGNQQRVQVAAALVHDPALLILDEPFSGLDPVAVDAMAGLLRERAHEGVPVLFSSHQLDLVERLCEQVVIIDHGRVVAAGTPDEVRAGVDRSADNGAADSSRNGADHGADRTAADDADHTADHGGGRQHYRLVVQPDAGWLRDLPGVDVLDVEGPVALVRLSAGDVQRVLGEALRRGTVHEFSPVRRALSDVYREVVR